MTWSGTEMLHAVECDLDLAGIVDAALVHGCRFLPTSARRFHVEHADTTDLRLLRWGVRLGHVEGEGWRVATPSGAELALAGSAGEVPGEASDLTTVYRRGAPLAVRVRERVVRRGGDVVTEDGTPLAALRVDEVAVMGDRGSPPPFAVLRVAVAEDAPARLVADLRDAAAGVGEEVAATWPFRTALGPIGTSARDEVEVAELGSAPTVGDLVRRAVAASVVRLFHADPVARIGEDPEGVHQMRVATRRLRSDLRTFRPYVDAAWAEPLRDELRWLGRSLGGVRDGDVMADRLRSRIGALDEDDRSAGERLLARLDTERAQARAELLEVLGSGRYEALAERLVAAAQGPPLTEKAADSADETLREVVPFRKLRRAVAGLGPYSDFDELHQVRIRAKRARYAAEAVAPVVGGRARRFAKEAARLQDVLGDYCDAVVLGRWLRAAAGRTGRQEAYVAGVLAGEERVAAESHLGEVPDVWKRVRRKARRLGI